MPIFPTRFSFPIPPQFIPPHFIPPHPVPPHLSQAGMRQGQPGEEAVGGVQLEVRRFLGGVLRGDHRFQPLRGV